MAIPLVSSTHYGQDAWVIRHQRLDFVLIHIVRSKIHASDGIQHCDQGQPFAQWLFEPRACTARRLVWRTEAGYSFSLDHSPRDGRQLFTSPCRGRNATSSIATRYGALKRSVAGEQGLCCSCAGPDRTCAPAPCTIQDPTLIFVCDCSLTIHSLRMLSGSKVRKPKSLVFSFLNFSGGTSMGSPCLSTPLRTTVKC